MKTMQAYRFALDLTPAQERAVLAILSATVRRHGGRWQVAFTCEVDRAAQLPTRPGAVVGVDVGLKHLAVLSTGELVPNPRHLDKAGRRIRCLAQRVSRRVGPDRRSGRKPSRRWE